jgi:hypothetical protein
LNYTANRSFIALVIMLGTFCWQDSRAAFDSLVLPQAAAAIDAASVPQAAANSSGFFYDPLHDGEGFVIEVIADDRVAIYWFTYDQQGNQRWFIGVGEIDASGITVGEWHTTKGARFGQEFDPMDVEYRVAGNARFSFNSCNAMDVEYTIDGTLGTQNLVRLTSVADINCNGLMSYRSGLTGSFYDPARDGEGVVLHVFDHDRAAVVFFTYNDSGEQMWVLGTGTIIGATLQLDAPFTTRGGRFGSDFDPADVVHVPWGGLSLQLGCENTSIGYEPQDSELGDGSSSMQRLTYLAGLNCDAGATFILPGLECNDFQRTLLTAARLDGPTGLGPVSNEEFTPDQDCLPPSLAFNGTLRFTVEDINVDGSVEAGQRIFPAIDIDLVSVDDYLVPVQAGLLRGSSGSYWEIVFSTGRIWSEPGDGGRSRAAIPFTMSDHRWNQAHHGLMTFLYDAGTISNVHFQVTQENLPWNTNVNFHGVLDPGYVPAVSIDPYTTERPWRRDMAMRLPTRPLSDLGDQFEDAVLADFNRGLPLNKISQAGIAYGGVLYLQPAFTRTGDHPYEQEMRHGAFSVSKTAGAGVAMLRLAQKYGESVFDELIRDHIDVTAPHGGWNNVTFGDTLSMATGIGDAYPNRIIPVTFADEGDDSNPHWFDFNYSDFMADRLAGAFSFGNYPWDPGEVMRYNSAHTMILAIALDNYLKSKEGPQADLWQMLNAEVYQPIGIRWLPSMRLRIDNSTPGPVPMGWGLLPNPHDIVRIASLLHNGGRFEGTQLLHRGRTAQMMRHNEEPALDTAEQTMLLSGSWVNTSYRDATWSSVVQPWGTCNRIASRMEGLGGNFIVMMPDGMTLFRFADANVYEVGAMVLTGERISPSCPAQPTSQSRQE